MGSTSGSRTNFTTVCATRSAMVGIPKGRIPPLAFGISTRRTGGAKYDPDDIRFQTLKRLLFRSFSKAAMETPSTPAAPRFSFTCSQASQTRRLEMSYGFASDIGSSRRRLADFFGWKIGSLRSARVTRPRRYYEPVRPCATHRYSAFGGAATSGLSLGIAAQVPTFRTRACHRDPAASIPVAARPVGRLPPGLVPKEGRAFGFDNFLNGFRYVIGGSLTFAFPIHT